MLLEPSFVEYDWNEIEKAMEIILKAIDYHEELANDNNAEKH